MCVIRVILLNKFIYWCKHVWRLFAIKLVPHTGPERFDQHLWHHPCTLQGTNHCCKFKIGIQKNSLNHLVNKVLETTNTGEYPVDTSCSEWLSNESILPRITRMLQGQNYNIPISLWLLDTHPYHAPLCFVKPTPDMQIKVKICPLKILLKSLFTQSYFYFQFNFFR